MKISDFNWYRIAGAALCALAAGLVIWGVVHVVTAPGRERSKAVAAQTGQAVAEGKAESAADATNTVADQSAKDDASEALTRSNGNEIDKTEGATTSVGKPLDSSGRRALCLRRAYRDTDECKQLLRSNP